MLIPEGQTPHEAYFVVVRDGAPVAKRLDQMTKPEFHQCWAKLDILASAYESSLKTERDWTLRRLYRESADWLRSACLGLVVRPDGSAFPASGRICVLSGELDLESLFFVADRDGKQTAVRIWELDDSERESYSRGCRIIAEAFHAEREAIDAYCRQKFGRVAG